jgi:hypothetical protein
MGAEVAYQVAASAETRTPNLHRAKIAQQKSADGRMATEAAWLKGRDSQEGNRKTSLTLTGLLMEGLFSGIMWVIEDVLPDRAPSKAE